MKPINEPVFIVGWVKCTRPTSTLTKDKKYKVRNCFSYLNTYGSGRDKFKKYDTFLTIKNDLGYTVKVRLTRFEKCEAPLTDRQRITKLEEEVKVLKNRLNITDNEYKNSNC